MRNWLHAEDTASAILHIVEHGEVNRIYNISGNYEASNKEVISKILKNYFGKPVSLEDYAQFNFVRMGEDVRYSLDDSALKSLGWQNCKQFDEELAKIVEHFKNKFVW